MKGHATNMTANFHVTKPSRKNPTVLRSVRDFDTFDDALRWATRYIYKDDVRLFIDNKYGHRLATVEYDAVDPVVRMSAVH